MSSVDRKRSAGRLWWTWSAKGSKRARWSRRPFRQNILVDYRASSQFVQPPEQCDLLAELVELAHAHQLRLAWKGNPRRGCAGMPLEMRGRPHLRMVPDYGELSEVQELQTSRLNSNVEGMRYTRPMALHQQQLLFTMSMGLVWIVLHTHVHRI